MFVRSPSPQLALGSALGAALVFASGCTTLASSPSWVGGARAETAAARIEAEEAALAKEAADQAREPSRIGAKHILVMHAGSERKPEGITRSKDEAKKRATEALAKIRAGAAFDDLVKQYSDEPGAAARNGDLGVFEKKVMVRAFAEIAFKLEVGQVSEVVETPFGFHVIQRTE